MAATYDPALVAAKDQVRLLIADNNVDANGDVVKPNFQDEEIAWFILNSKNIYYAAADAAEQLASRYAGKADKYVGPLRVMYRDFQDRYKNLANALRQQSGRRGGFKATLTAPQRDPLFNIGMHDINPDALTELTTDPTASNFNAQG
jgi:hypothetical protein